MEKMVLDGKQVCVVDDDEIFRHYLAALLADKKIDVIEAADGSQLIDVLSHQRVDCVVLDYMLAAESGLTVHEHLRGCFRKPPPVVMLTADESQRTAIRAFRTGVSDYVLKRGLRPDELLGAIFTAISRRQEEDALEEDLSRLRQLTVMDDATGLYRREAVEERLDRIAKAAARRQGRYAVIIIAVTELEIIETQFGPAVGDQVMRHVAARIKKELRHTDVCGRWGLDSFIYIIDADEDQRSVEQLAAALERALSFALSLNTMSCNISASLGIAMYPAHGADAATIVAAAEQAAAATQAERTAPGAVSTSGIAEADARIVARQGDRRRERRKRVLKRGQIVVNELRSVIDCTIRDISDDGARLRVDGHFAAPEQFDLSILGSGAVRRVRLRWQAGRELGVQFIG